MSSYNSSYPSYSTPTYNYTPVPRVTAPATNSYSYNNLGGATNFNNLANNAYGTGNSLKGQAGAASTASVRTAMQNLGSAASNLGSAAYKTNQGANLGSSNFYSNAAANKALDARLADYSNYSSTGLGNQGLKQSGINTFNANLLSPSASGSKARSSISAMGEKLGDAQQLYNMGRALSDPNMSLVNKGLNIAGGPGAIGSTGRSAGALGSSTEFYTKGLANQDSTLPQTLVDKTRPITNVTTSTPARVLDTLSSIGRGDNQFVNFVDKYTPGNLSKGLSSFASKIPGVNWLNDVSAKNALTQGTPLQPGQTSRTDNQLGSTLDHSAGSIDARTLANQYSDRFAGLSKSQADAARAYSTGRSKLLDYNKKLQAGQRAYDAQKTAFAQKQAAMKQKYDAGTLTQQEYTQLGNERAAMMDTYNQLQAGKEAVGRETGRLQDMYNNRIGAEGIYQMNRNLEAQQRAAQQDAIQRARGSAAIGALSGNQPNNKFQDAVEFVTGVGSAVTGNPLLKTGGDMLVAATKIPQTLDQRRNYNPAVSGGIQPALNKSGYVDAGLEQIGQGSMNAIHGARPTAHLRDFANKLNNLIGGGDIGRFIATPFGILDNLTGEVVEGTVGKIIRGLTDSTPLPSGTDEGKGLKNFGRRFLGNLFGVVPGGRKALPQGSKSGVVTTVGNQIARQDAENRKRFGDQGDVYDRALFEGPAKTARDLQAPTATGPTTDPNAYREYMGAETSRYGLTPSYSGSTGIVPGMMLNEQGNMVRATPGNITQRASYSPPSIIPPMRTKDGKAFSVMPTPMVYQPDTIRYGGGQTGLANTSGMGGFYIPGNMSRSVLDRALTLPQMSFTPRAIGVKPGTNQFDGTMLPAVHVGHGGAMTMPPQPMMSDQELAALQSNMDAAFAGKSQENRNAPIKTDRGLRDRMAQTQRMAEGKTPQQVRNALEAKRNLEREATRKPLTPQQKAQLDAANNVIMKYQAWSDAGLLDSRIDLTRGQLAGRVADERGTFKDRIFENTGADTAYMDQMRKVDARIPTGVQRLKGGGRPSNDEMARKGRFAPKPNVRTNDLPRRPTPPVRGVPTGVDVQPQGFRPVQGKVIRLGSLR